MRLLFIINTIDTNVELLEVPCSSVSLYIIKHVEKRLYI